MNQIVIKDGWQLNKNYEKILRMVERNEGCCPCQYDHPKCPCSKYIDSDVCCCKLYIKVEETK